MAGAVDAHPLGVGVRFLADHTAAAADCIIIITRRSEEDSDFFARVTRLRAYYNTILSRHIIIILYTYYNDMRCRVNSARVTLNRLCYYHRRRRRHYRVIIVIHYYIYLCCRRTFSACSIYITISSYCDVAIA